MWIKTKQVIAFSSAQQVKSLKLHALCRGDCLVRVTHSVCNLGLQFAMIFFVWCQSVSNSHATLQSQVGTHLKDDTAIQQRWREHFELLLNRETLMAKYTILSIPQHPERFSTHIATRSADHASGS